MFRLFDCVVALYSLCQGRALQSDPWPMTRGWLLEGIGVIETLLAVGPVGWLSEGFPVSTSIPRVRLRRGRPLWIPSHDAAGRSLPFILIVFDFSVVVVFVFCFLPDHRFWCGLCSGSI